MLVKYEYGGQSSRLKRVEVLRQFISWQNLKEFSYLIFEKKSKFERFLQSPDTISIIYLRLTVITPYCLLLINISSKSAFYFQIPKKLKKKNSCYRYDSHMYVYGLP